MQLSTRISQSRGCLLGLAIGDALGAPLEGLSPSANSCSLRSSERFRRRGVGVEEKALPLADARGFTRTIPSRRSPWPTSCWNAATPTPTVLPRFIWPWRPQKVRTWGLTAAWDGVSAWSSPTWNGEFRRVIVDRRQRGSAQRCESLPAALYFADDAGRAFRFRDSGELDDAPRYPQPGRSDGRRVRRSSSDGRGRTRSELPVPCCGGRQGGRRSHRRTVSDPSHVARGAPSRRKLVACPCGKPA